MAASEREMRERGAVGDMAQAIGQARVALYALREAVGA